MKITLAINQVAQEEISAKGDRSFPFLAALNVLHDLPLAGDELVWLDRASEKIIQEVNRYIKLRGEFVKKHGEKVGEDGWRIPEEDLLTRKKWFLLDQQLRAEKFEIRIVRKFKLPADNPLLSAKQYRLLLDAGLIEPFTAPDPDPEPASDPAAQAAPQSEAKADPQPAGVPSKTPDPEPAKLPAPVRNGHPPIKPKKPKSQLSTR